MNPSDTFAPPERKHLGQRKIDERAQYSVIKSPSATFVAQRRTGSWIVQCVGPDQNQALMTRTLSGIAHVLETLTDTDVVAALEAPTDIGVMARVLSSAVLERDLVKLDPTADLILNGAYRKRELLKSAGGAYSSQQVADIIGIERQSVDKRRKANTLIAVPLGEDYGYPACQFDSSGMVKGLAEALKVMPIHDGWMRLEWLLTPDSVLGERSPLEELKAGRITDVIDVAAAQG
ncbi:MAG: hypothetical protein SFV19_11735 [Rhodospirillaceae bacterium]|nr:hypothetical protein [Rhodospirillaceae bacterium]